MTIEQAYENYARSAGPATRPAKEIFLAGARAMFDLISQNGQIIAHDDAARAMLDEIAAEVYPAEAAAGGPS